MSTIWRVFEPILEIQQQGSTARAAELSAALAEHIDWTREVVETALKKAPDDDVRQRLEDALDRFRSVLSEIDRAIEADNAELLTSALELNFAGAAVRTQESPWGLLSQETFSAPPSFETPVAGLSSDGDDLRPLHGAAFPPAILARADALGRDPQRLYDFVAALEHALYAGHFRAPFEVLADGIGNAADLSGLLAELLRASGIRAKLVHGMIRLPRRTAAAWLDVYDPETILRDAGFTVMASAETIDILPHVHVRALLGDRWVDLDPSVRPAEIVSPGDRTWTERPWNEAEFLGDTHSNDSPLAAYESRLGAVEPRVRRRAAPDPAFPPPLPFETLAFSNEQNVFPPDQEYRFGFQLVGPNGVMLEHRYAAPGHSRERIALRWSPATKTAEALIQTAGTAVAAPAFALDLRPRLEIGTTVIEGTGHAPAGTPLYFHVTIDAPDFRLARRGEARPLCGTDWELAFEGPGSLLGGPVPVDPPNTPLVTGARSWGAFPTPVVRAYHRRLALAARRVAALTGASGFSGPLVTMCAASLETFVIGGVAARRRPSGLLLDVKSIVLRLYDSGGTASLAPFVELFFCEGSHQEASVLIDRLGLDAISAVSALRTAAAENNPLRVIRAEASEEIETLDHPPRVRRTLSMLLGLGGRESITISQRPVVFGMREMSAWIARGGPAPSSDYAIAGLSGGYTRDEPRKPPKVKVVDLPKEKLTVVRQAIDYGAIAWDEDGNDYTSMIQWSTLGNLPGGGAGGSATYTPPEAGTTVVMVSVGGGMFEDTGGGSTDFSNCVACDVKVLELVFDQSPELIHVPPHSPLEYFEPMGRYHYRDKDPTPSPAVLAAKKSGTAQLHLRVGPLTKEPAQLKIEGSGRGEGKELFTIRGEKQVSKGFDGNIQVEVTGGDTIGIADVIEWKFTINSFAPLEEQTKVEVFVAGDWADAVDYHKFYYEYFRQACTWAKGKSPGDTEEILRALLFGRKGYDIKFSYARDAGNFLDGLLRARSGHCPEMAMWMLALAAVHGIEGKMLQIGVASLEEAPKDSTGVDATGWHWKSWRVGLKGINNPDFDDKNPDNIPPLVAAGQYATHNGKTDPKAMGSSAVLAGKVWQFNTHKLAVFDFGKGPLVYDASPDDIPEPFPLLHMGRVVLPTTDSMRKGYLYKLMTYLVGIIPLSDGTWTYATVRGADVFAVGEPLAVGFSYL